MYKIVDKFVKMNQIYKTLFYVRATASNSSAPKQFQKIVL